MSLWGNKDYESGNLKPRFANTTNTNSANAANIIATSTIHGSKANTIKFYGSMYGVSATEAATTEGKKPAHAGWVSQKIGTGGRAGRITYETIIAMGSITGDDPKDNTTFSGI